MTKLISNQILDYLDVLEQTLRLAPDQSREIRDEVRADLSAHIERHVESGCDEAQAVELALAEMGPPDELARQMCEAVPPLSGPVVRALRYLATVLFAILTVWIFWDVRANSYGVSFVRTLAFATVFTPIVLMVWPGVIWRKNSMFTTLPTAVIFVAVVVLMSLGQSTTTEALDSTAVRTPEYPTDPRSPLPLSITGFLALAVLTTLTIYLLAMMQRRWQRVGALFAALLVLVVIEVPYTIEEHRYTEELEQVRHTLRTFKNEHSTYPTPSEFEEQRGSNVFHYALHDGGTGYTLFWNRMMQPGYALCYSSDKGQMWIND